MTTLDLRAAKRLFYGSTEAQALYLGSDLLWRRPQQIAEFYGTGPGQVPLRLQSSTAVLSAGNVQRIPNAGGAGSPFDLIAGTPAITLAGAAMDLSQDEWLRFSNTSQPAAPDLMATTVFIVADVMLGSVDQYFLGSGSPQANVWLLANGSQMRFSRRNPTTNSVEQVNIALSPAIATGLRIYEVEFLPGAPAANGQTSGGVINVRVNGVLRGTASHPYPEFRAWNFATGQNPTSGNGLVARVSDIVSIIQGGDYAARVPAIRKRLDDLYGVSTAPAPSYDPDALALFARFDTDPGPERKQLISDMFVAGKATTWWGKLDALWVHAAHGAEAGRLNWLSTRFNCLPVNGPVFTVDWGYAGDGVSSYLDTQFNPFVEAHLGSKFQLLSASLGIRCNTESTAASSIAGAWDGTTGITLNPRNGTSFAGRLNQRSQTSRGLTVATAIGMTAISRSDAVTSTLYRNGVIPSTGAAQGADTALVNRNIFLGGINTTSLRANQFCMGWVGAALTDAEMLSLFDWFTPYRTALGIT